MLLRAQSFSSSQSSSKLLGAHLPLSLHELSTTLSPVSTAPSPADPAVWFCPTSFLNLSSGLERERPEHPANALSGKFICRRYFPLPASSTPLRAASLEPVHAPLSLLEGPVPLLPAHLNASLSKAQADVTRRRADVPVRRACPGTSVLGYPESPCLSLAWAVRLGDATPRPSVQGEPHFPPLPLPPDHRITGGKKVAPRFMNSFWVLGAKGF